MMSGMEAGHLRAFWRCSDCGGIAAASQQLGFVSPASATNAAGELVELELAPESSLQLASVGIEPAGGRGSTRSPSRCTHSCASRAGMRGFPSPTPRMLRIFLLQQLDLTFIVKTSVV
jgi:hypothetical protein